MIALFSQYGLFAMSLMALAANASAFKADLGVFALSTGKFLARVTSGPTAGQYAVSTGGVYTFASADAGLARKLYYSYGASGSGQTITVTNPLMDSGPTFRAALVQTFRGKQLVLTAWACQSFKLAMPLKQDDFTLPEIDFSAQDDGAGNILTPSMAGA